MDSLTMAKYRTVMMGQRKGRCDLNVPTTGVVRHLCPDLDQTTNNPLHRTPDLFATKVEKADHVKMVIGQNSHLQAGVVGLETVATGLCAPGRGNC